MSVTINGAEYNCTHFAFDGCHKIYLLMHPQDMEEARACDYDIFPVSALARIWRLSCPLKFIETWDLTVQPVPQFYEEDGKRVVIYA